MSDRSHEEERPSFGFWVMVTLAALYLGLRLVQGVVWVFTRLF